MQVHSSASPSENSEVINGVAEEFATAAKLGMDNRDQLSLSGYERNPFYRNQGGSFEDIGPMIGMDTVLDSRSVVSADFDGDGDLDIVLRNLLNPRLLYFENVAPDQGNWVRVTLQGVDCNRDAVGARVTVTAGDRVQTQLLAAGSGFLTQQSPCLHFGLGKKEAADSITVTWPGGGQQTFANIPAGETVHVVQKSK